MTPIPAHGGQLRRLAQTYGLDPTHILDFSANINPDGPPGSVLLALQRSLTDPRTLTTYPDLELYELRTAIAAHRQRAAPDQPDRLDPASIVVANGFVPLLEAAVRSRRLARCLLPVPAFSEYRATLERNGVAVVPHLLAPQTFACDLAALEHHLQITRADSILLANPQNPSGVLTAASTLHALAERNRHVQVLLDEAFIDYAPRESLTLTAARLPNLIVFRSVTKFFAMPGLRIAYAVAQPDVSAAIFHRLPPWPVSTLAVQAALAALADHAFAEEALALNQERRDILQSSLEALVIRSAPAAANYLLLEISQAAQVWERLLAHHAILLRRCDNFENLTDRFLRTAVRDQADNARLISALNLELA